MCSPAHILIHRPNFIFGGHGRAGRGEGAGEAGRAGRGRAGHDRIGWLIDIIAWPRVG